MRKLSRWSRTALSRCGYAAAPSLPPRRPPRQSASQRTTRRHARDVVTPADDRSRPNLWQYQLIAGRYPIDRSIVFSAKARMPLAGEPEVVRRPARQFQARLGRSRSVIHSADRPARVRLVLYLPNCAAKMSCRYRFGYSAHSPYTCQIYAAVRLRNPVLPLRSRRQQPRASHS